MKIGEWSATPDLTVIYREIRALGIETNLAELDAFGSTSVENALSPDLAKRLRDAVVDLTQERNGKVFDLQNETEHREVKLTPDLLY